MIRVARSNNPAVEVVPNVVYFPSHERPVHHCVDPRMGVSSCDPRSEVIERADGCHAQRGPVHSRLEDLITATTEK